MMQTVTEGVIISGGHLDEQFVCRFLSEQFEIEKDASREGKVLPQMIAADAGLAFCRRNGLLPAHIVGDFDSSGTEILEGFRDIPGIQIRRFQPEKDYTDTEIALQLACELGWKRVYILGGTGTRLDHVLGNIQVLALARAEGVEAVLADPHNRITFHDRSFSLSRSAQWGRYVSLFAWGGDVPDLTLSGFKYELIHACLETKGSLGVSNEIAADEAQVVFSSGSIVCIESRD